MWRPATRPLASLVRPAALVLLLAVAIAGVLGSVVAASGLDPATAFAALIRGAIGSRYAVLSATLVRATPLILTGLAVALAFRGGILNIGAEGQLLAGATAATAVALVAGQSLGAGVIVLGLLAAAAAGGVWASIPMLLRRHFAVLEVITTIMMNFVALYAVGWLVRGPLQEPTRIYPQSAAIPRAAQLPFLVEGQRLHAGFVLAVLLCLVTWWGVSRTAGGFRLRVVGANPSAAATAAQVNVARVTGRAFLASGALAGLAGGVEVLGVTYALYDNLSPGYGYTAIAVALLAGLNPALVIASGVFLGGLAAGAAAMQREAGVPSVLVSVVEAAIILAIVGGRVVLARQQALRTEAGT